MNGNKRNFSLSIWDHKDNYICLLKSSNSDFNGQSYQEDFVENVTGEKTLTFSIPMYVFDPDIDKEYKFRENECWRHIYNEQKIRYTKYDDITNQPIRIEEFVLKEFTEERSGEEKIANCTCESLAVYELGKVGWGISFDVDYINDYENNTTTNPNYDDLITLDYWLRKIFYKETNLGRVSTTTECTYLLQGLQLRNEDGFPISNTYVEKEDGSRDYEIIDEPVCSTTDDPNFEKYYNPVGWTWEVQATFENDPDKVSISTLYESPVITKYIEKIPNYYEAQSYQKRIGTSDDTKELRTHPIPDNEKFEWTYVTDVKKRLISVERSNIFSIIQDLCEAFEIWAYFIYNYTPDGKIYERKILFKTESIDEDIKFDFSYGKNLQSCSRVTNSNDLITKLIIPAVESNLVDGNLLSIQQASANPTGENYLYNFDYFYELGTFTKEESFSTNSDEYKIKLHCGKLRDTNNKIINLQKFLTPLYNKQSELQSELIVQEGAKTGYMDNIQSIQDKIDAIPANEQIIKSWTADNTQYSHVGPVKTFSATTLNGEEYQYLNFGRDDITVATSTLEITIRRVKDDEIITLSTEQYPIPGFTPRSFNYQSWHTGDNIIPESDDSEHFTLFEPDQERNVVYNYSELGENIFIKGIYFRNQERGVYSRIRYEYAPLAYYYLLVQDYWEKIDEVQKVINDLEKDLNNINNKILTYELDLKKLLNDKRELILQFEKQYKPFIREGYWEPSDYQAQVNNITLNTDDSTNFDGLFNREYRLKELNLNDSLSTYSYYIELDNLSSIDLDSIEMSTETVIDDVPIRVPRYRGHDYELYSTTTGESLIIGISPDLITKMDKELIQGKYSKQCILTYDIHNDDSTTTCITTAAWTQIDENNDPVISEHYIYVSNDNILTSSLKVYGDSISTTNELEVYNDYNYSFESTAYNEETGQRIDTSEWDGSENIYYDYSLKIELKLTNNVTKFLSDPMRFIVTYLEDTTLQYLFNDSVATSDKYAFPQVEYTISVVDLSSLNEYRDYEPKIGQKVPIWDLEMGLKGYEGFITSISYNLEERHNTELTIATYNTKFEDVFQKLTATMTDVSYNQAKITNAANSFESNGEIKTEVFRRSLNDNFDRILLGNNNDISIDKTTGITLKDNNSSNAVKLIGNGIFLTENYDDDSEVRWRTGITGKGINADAITAGNIDTKQINIWNSSEGQIRFRWNDQGLFAYGDGIDLNAEGGVSTSTATTTDLDKIIDYSKFVKFNQDGINFSDGGRSALSLNWTGLNINTQENALSLDAKKGLILTQWEGNNSTDRLQLGKLDGGNIYGLKLKDTSGSTTFQSDSDGNLWLSKFINIGGNFDDSVTFKPILPTAGIVGITTDEPRYEMSVMRDTATGNVIFKSTQLRFWAGPQQKQQYLENLAISQDDIENATTYESWSTKWDSINDYDPALSKFKVDSEGNIVASGIDVGGWIGAGKILRSRDYEAILRSDNYEKYDDTLGTTTELPVLAIGKNGENSDSSEYNFRVYRDGTINIGNGQFIASSTGAINAANISINSSDSTITGGAIAGWHITETGIEKESGNYKTGMYAIANSTSNAIEIGHINNPEFTVNGNGELKASAGEIGGWTISGTTGIKNVNNNNSTFIKPNSNNNKPVIWIGTSTEAPNSVSTNITNFSVTGQGDVYFKHGIYGWSSTKNAFKKGLTEGSALKIYTENKTTIDVEICQGLIIDIRENV